MDGLFLSCACLMGICGLPEAPSHFETAAPPAPIVLAVANSPRAPRAARDSSAPLAERPVPTVASPGSEAPVSGEADKLSRAAITEVVQQKTGAIKHCYERALIEDQTYGGTVEIAWKIQTDGRVSAATVIDAAKRNATAEGCLVSEILTWQFPAASEPTAVGVYPFVLDAHLLAHHGTRQSVDGARPASAPAR